MKGVIGQKLEQGSAISLNTSQAPVVHEGQVVPREGMAVQWDDGKAGCRGSDMRKYAGTSSHAGQVQQVQIIPGWGHILEERRIIRDLGYVPRKTKAITVERFLLLVTVDALVDY